MKSGKDEITAKIGVFSGRPNPELSLRGEVAEKLASMLKATLGKESIHPPPSPRLGYYYGFLVQISKEMARQLEIPMEFNVYHGVITEVKPKEQNHWRDVERIEKFLVDLAYEQGYGKLLEEFGVEKKNDRYLWRVGDTR